ncbi:hypothetical protein V5799_019807, partial [Amblyomma americanum]
MNLICSSLQNRYALYPLGCVCGGSYYKDNTTCRYAWEASHDDTEQFHGRCFKGLCVPSACNPQHKITKRGLPIGCEVKCKSGNPVDVLYYPSGRPCV